MNITLSLVGLYDKQVGHVTANVVLVARSVTAKDLLKSVITNESALKRKGGMLAKIGE